LKRVLVAVVGIPLLIALLSYAPDWATMLLMVALCAVGAHELMHAVTGNSGKQLVALTVTVAGLLPVCIYAEYEQAGLRLTALPLVPFTALLAMLFVFLLFVAAIRRYDRETAIPFADVTAAIFAGLVFPLMLSCLLRARLFDGGSVLVWVPLAVSFGSDTCALFAGMAFGKHKLAPRVSPHKTVEGGIGGLLGGILGLLILRWIVQIISGTVMLEYWKIILLGVFGAAVSEVGDLSFSVIKREFGVKDYGKLLPGHGGVLDRFDSVTFVAPLIWFLLSIVR